MTDSPEYKKKRAFYDNLLTIYGRKPVLEALQDHSINIYKLHLADSNKSGGIIEQINSLAEQRGIEVQWHNRQALSRISRNSKQDQGVAADIQLDQHQSVSEFIQQQQTNTPYRLLALDSITNPQNLGMIIRSASAGHIDGIIIPRKGCAALSPLVIKASVGTVFKATLIHCETLQQALEQFQQQQATICTLSSHAKDSLFDYQCEQSIIYVLGNETDGVSQAVSQLSDQQLAIPMNNGVESLNVAVTAALIAFVKPQPE
ncbi:TrmH family RNA methyltransferase [Oceanicoccus sagamiensis]|uniref:23S rRNA (Guanosine(2251)-2'-O)-methyltransferase RlmB n=1 Tax=Oceanicoccus sagamiensis TaxID=716816 RepID=A0A1X9NER7_9GAMM|nr:RNA methyltransferase [Oceanicoccus sagamiensis]ARN75661.1 23S rRNA (guanosine(2251)-2'-O)-methyltransferase RlmB [Oceanicoccus sagamiensis]